MPFHCWGQQALWKVARRYATLHGAPRVSLIFLTRVTLQYPEKSRFLLCAGFSWNSMRTRLPFIPPSETNMHPMGDDQQFDRNGSEASNAPGTDQSLIAPGKELGRKNWSSGTTLSNTGEVSRSQDGGLPQSLVEQRSGSRFNRQKMPKTVKVQYLHNLPRMNPNHSSSYCVANGDESGNAGSTWRKRVCANATLPTWLSCMSHQGPVPNQRY
ncbi:hypothetical protein BJ170DRAFT_721589 [Xylariales sp. AK1849]|nr:hypothetical protein BJ170DRAFT_721589 [Xylariales sp. AK1849]